LLLHAQTLQQSQDSIVNMVLRLWTGQLKNHASLLAMTRDFSLLQTVQTCSRAQWDSCLMGTSGPLHGV